MVKAGLQAIACGSWELRGIFWGWDFSHQGPQPLAALSSIACQIRCCLLTSSWGRDTCAFATVRLFLTETAEGSAEGKAFPDNPNYLNSPHAAISELLPDGMT